MSVEAITWAIKQDIPRSSAKFVLVMMANLADDNGEAWPSCAYMTAATNQNRKTVLSNFSHLCDLGFLEDTGKRVGRTESIKVYRLNMEAVPKTVPLSSPKNGTVKQSQNRDSLKRSSPKNGHEAVPKTDMKQSQNRDTDTKGTLKGTRKKDDDAEAPSTRERMKGSEPLHHRAPLHRDAPPRKTKTSRQYTPEFLQAWEQYPKREGSNPKDKAFSAWNARLAEGHSVETMTQGIARYAKYCEQKGNVGTPYVKQAASFLGPADPPNFTEVWAAPAEPEPEPLEWHQTQSGIFEKARQLGIDPGNDPAGVLKHKILRHLDQPWPQHGDPR